MYGCDRICPSLPNQSPTMWGRPCTSGEGRDQERETARICLATCLTGSEDICPPAQATKALQRKLVHCWVRPITGPDPPAHTSTERPGSVSSI